MKGNQVLHQLFRTHRETDSFRVSLSVYISCSDIRASHSEEKDKSALCECGDGRLAARAASAGLYVIDSHRVNRFTGVAVDYGMSPFMDAPDRGECRGQVMPSEAFKPRSGKEAE